MKVIFQENVTQINGGITIIVNMSVRNVMNVKKIMFETLLHVVVKMENIQQVLWMIQGSFVMKLQSHTMKMQKLSVMAAQEVFRQILMIFLFFYLYFCRIFINYYIIINKWQYLRLSHKMSSKTKRFIIIQPQKIL